MEGEDTVSPSLKLDENALGEEFQSFRSAGSNLDSIFQEPPPVFFSKRKRSSEKSIDEEVSNRCVYKLKVNTIHTKMLLQAFIL